MVAHTETLNEITYCSDLLKKDDLLAYCPSMQSIDGVRIDTVTVGQGAWYKCSIVITDQENTYGTAFFANIMESPEVARERFRLVMHEGTDPKGVSNLGDLAAMIGRQGETDLIVQKEHVFLELTRTNSEYCSDTAEILGLGEFLVNRAVLLKPTESHIGEP